MSYNIWNWDNGNWTERLPRVAQVIREAAPDIVGLQENRMPSRDSARSQATQLLALLPGFSLVVQTAAMAYPDGISEGLALLTKLPRSDVGGVVEVELAASSPADLNRRAGQSATFSVDGLHLRIFHSHLSYDRALQLSQMQELLGFADAAAAPADVVDVLLGDLNTYSDYEAPIDLATRAGWRDGAPLAERGSGTFPSWAPIHRPDRILLRLPRTLHLDVGYQLLGAPPAHVTTVESAKRFAASDHLAVLVALSVERAHDQAEL